MADLTNVAVAAAAPAATRREIPVGKVVGLYLVVQPSGLKSWALRYRRDGRSLKFTIGPYPAVTLSDARSRAREAWGVIERGEEPGAHKKAVRAAAKAARQPEISETVEGVVDRFLELHARKNTRAKSAAEAQRILRREIVPAWKGRRLADIARKDVHAVLDAIIARGSPVMANRTLAALSKLCAWAEGRDIIASSPCERIKLPAKETSRDRVLTDDEVRKAWAAFEADGWPFGPLFKVMLLTGQREGQVAGMRWSEVDLDQRMWTLQMDRTKNATTHQVPLAPAVVAILESLPRIGPGNFVFSTTGTSAVSGFSNAKERIDRRAGNVDVEGGAGRWRLHDLRRTMTTGCAALGIAPHVTDAAIGHRGGVIQGVAAVYNRFSYLAERREALNKWADQVVYLVSSK